MVPVATSSSIPVETPSKKAAASLNQMSLQTPIRAPAFFEEFESAANAKEEESAKEEPLEEFRTRFVGDVDLDEKDEPLLKPSPRRFVLFPIQYHEVSTFPNAFCTSCAVFFRFTDASYIRVSLFNIIFISRFGKCIKKLKRVSGRLKRWICLRTTLTGKVS